jgi:hypothetical protein
VIIVIERRLKKPVHLRGWRCEIGTPLRFWYHGDPANVPLSHNPATPDELSRAGDLVATLAGEPTIAYPIGYHGSILFTGPGKWEVAVYQTDRLLGTVVIRVTAKR